MNATTPQSQPTAVLPPPATRARQVKVTRYRNGQPVPPTEETTTADTAIVDEEPNLRAISGRTNGVTTILDEEPISLDDLTPDLPTADDGTNPNPNPLLDPAISMTEDTSGFFDYTYSPPSE